MKKFEEVYEEMWPKIASDCHLCPNDFYILRRQFERMFARGVSEMKQQCIDTLTEKMNECNDLVPKTMYPSDKYKYAIKAINGVK